MTVGDEQSFDVCRSLENMQREIAGLSQAIRGLEHQLRATHDWLAHERHRVDILLAGWEGVLQEIEPFHQARSSEVYQRAFSVAQPLVSILIATMNRSDLLVDRCLKSIRDQTYTNLQVIVVGDHCTDDTEKRVAELRDSRICFVNRPHRGPYPRSPDDRWLAAGTLPHNEALGLVEGDFITYLDDDDYYAPERIETLVTAAQTEKADLVFHPFFARSADGSWTVCGNGILERGHVGLQMIMYHAYLGKIRQDLYTYRLKEPRDWNLIRKLKSLRPRIHFVNEPLTYYFGGMSAETHFVEQPGERFIE